MNILKLFFMGVLLFSTPLMLTACEDENAIEEGAEEISDEIDDAM